MKQTFLRYILMLVSGFFTRRRRFKQNFFPFLRTVEIMNWRISISQTFRRRHAYHYRRDPVGICDSETHIYSNTFSFGENHRFSKPLGTWKRWRNIEALRSDSLTSRTCSRLEQCLVSTVRDRSCTPCGRQHPTPRCRLQRTGTLLSRVSTTQFRLQEYFSSLQKRAIPLKQKMKREYNDYRSGRGWFVEVATWLWSIWIAALGKKICFNNICIIETFFVALGISK